MSAAPLRFAIRACRVAGVAALFFFSTAPVAWMLAVSLVAQPESIAGGAALLTLDNYRNILTDGSLHFGEYALNSVVVALMVSVAVSAIAWPGGYAVSRMQFPGRGLIPLAVLAASMFPPVSIAGYLYQLFAGLGLLNTRTALALPYVALTVPLSLWIAISYFEHIPRDLDRAARVDGAGRMRTLLSVILPLAAPGLVASFLLVFIACFNEFLLAIMLTSDTRAQTLPVGIALLEGLHGESPWGVIMAASSLAAVPLAVLTLLCQKYIVGGLTGGAVKG